MGRVVERVVAAEFLYRKGDTEAAFAVNVMVVVQAELVGFGEFAGNEQAEAVALGVSAEKRLKQAVAHVFGHARAVVAYVDAWAFLAADTARVDADTLAANPWLAMLAGVVEQDDENLLQMAWIDLGA